MLKNAWLNTIVYGSYTTYVKLRLLQSLVSQCYHWIDARGATRRQIPG
jgi:hypothetical protein